MLGVLPEILRVQLWLVPSIAALLAAMAALVMMWIDAHVDALGLPIDVGSASARAVLTSISGAMISFTALVFSVTMLVLQLASAQLSPRVTRSFLRDRFNQSVLGLFVATFVYSLLLLASVTPESVPQLGVLGAIGLVLSAVLAFVVYIDHMAQSIRPTSIMDAIADETRSTIDHLYPSVDDASDLTASSQAREAASRAVSPKGKNDSFVAWSDASGYIQAIDEGSLLKFAERQAADVELQVGVGHFLAPGIELLRLRDGASRSMTTSEADLDDCFHLGPERTMSKDPEFGFRQLVDVALRALSPSLNDPTTANQVIDRLHELLRHLQTRRITSPRIVEHDDGRTVVIPGPSWDSFLEMCVEEIGAACRSMPAVVSHLRMVLEDLRDAAPAAQAASVSHALATLDGHDREGDTA